MGKGREKTHFPTVQKKDVNFRVNKLEKHALGAIFGYFCPHCTPMRRILLFILVLFSLSATAQQREVQYSKDTLMKKRKELLEAIAETERQLEAIKSDKKATMGQLRALQNKLADRQRLIGNINQEMNQIDRTIRTSSREVQTLKQKLEQLKIRYAQSIRYAYSSRSSYDMLAFLFSSKDFNEAIRRMKYLKSFRDFRRYQVEQIAKTQTQLTQKIGVLNEEKSEKDKVLNAEVQQKKLLQQETEQTNKVVQDLRSKESKLMADIQKNKQINARVNKAINDLIEREMAKAAKAAETKSPGKSNIKTSSSTSPGVAVNNVKTEAKEKSDVELYLTPEAAELSNSFEGNRGKMLWPVEKGYIIDHFGTHPHPLAPQVMVENGGVTIQTSENAKVRTVFKGIVSKVFRVEGSGWTIIVTHGNYFTAYSGIESVSVKINEEVDAKDALGTVATNYEGIPAVNFQIWKGRIKQNPELWIGKVH